MLHVVCLAARDRRLLRARWHEHANSHRSMLHALLELGADDDCARLNALRAIEKQYDLDLAEICYRHERRNAGTTHPIERLVLDFITEERHDEDDSRLWVLPDRVQQVRELMAGRFSPSDFDDADDAA